MEYQWTGWDYPADILIKAGKIKDVMKMDVFEPLYGFSAGAGIERIEYTRLLDHSRQVGYIIWHASVDEVNYEWVTGDLTRLSAARMLLRTGIYKSILKKILKTTLW